MLKLFSIFITLLVFLMDTGVAAPYSKEKGQFILPPFDMEIVLTDRAKQQLLDMGERVKIVYYFSYNIGVSEKKIGSASEKPREVFLPSTGGIASMKEWRISERKRLSFEPYLLVNVVSARDKCTHNLLNCEIYSGDYPKNDQPIRISCDVISTPPFCH
ncbi:MAG: hypothetical protein KBB83_05345 [Alphaproteobacteria bacterium]|nr:hypothetical protein [Alphaproteobacteria bacterium]